MLWAMSTLFISDIHLDPLRPEIQSLFLSVLSYITGRVQNLYILGDLFEAWVGDDDLSTFNLEIIDGLYKAHQAGMKIFFIPGNRDFLIGKGFAERSGIKLLPDPCVIVLYGQKTLLTHGDLLCTDDHNYQRYRKLIQNPLSCWLLNHSPLKWRQKLADSLRQQSRSYQQQCQNEIMDINPQALKDWFVNYQCQQIIHGHTHRPSIHYLCNNEQVFRHYVLSDWHTQANALLVDEQGHYQLVNFDQHTMNVVLVSNDKNAIVN